MPPAPQSPAAVHSTVGSGAAPTTVVDAPWARQVEDLVGEFSTSVESGLDSDDAERRLEQSGPNVLTVERGTSSWRRLASQFHQPLIYILLAAAAVTGVLQEWVDVAVILAVVFINAAIGYVEETRAKSALDALARAMTPEATVLRDGDEHRVDARNLVPGDVVLLRSGDKVPADLRLARSRSLRLDESALTGEAVPVGKEVEAVDADTVLGDRTSMAHASTVVTFGQGAGIVVATGDRTELGQVSGLLTGVQQLETPLTRKINQFSRSLVVAILALAAATFAVGLLRGLDRAETFMAAVALIVAAIPEGLPAAMTIVLAIGVARMADRRAIIRRLPAVETLGSTTVVCSDKTGTLTANEMTVTRVSTGGRLFELSGVGYDPTGHVSSVDAAGPDDHEPWNTASRRLCAAVCCATTPVSSRASRGTGWSRGTRPKRRWSWRPARRSCISTVSRPVAHDSTPCRSSPTTSTWRRCTTSSRTRRVSSI